MRVGRVGAGGAEVFSGRLRSASAEKEKEGEGEYICRLYLGYYLGLASAVHAGDHIWRPVASHELHYHTQCRQDGVGRCHRR